jgi:molybdopterin/thiamine biosynthesis adenylyltransferase
MPARGKSVTVIGAGNIGSHLIPHLARTPGVGRVTLVDRQHYDDAANLWSQDIRRRDLGRAKAAVQARRLREIDPTLPVVAIDAAVETVPLGALRADVLLTCVDSRKTRRAVSHIAWKLGTPWIDAGVSRDGWLCRVNVYVPGPDRACIECGWSDEHYAGLEQTFPCHRDDTPAPTDAPSALGGLAAALQALECRKLFAADWENLMVDRQVTVSALTHRQSVTRFTANPGCRFDHRILDVVPLDVNPTSDGVAELLARGGDALGARAEVGVRVVDQRFATRLACVGCGASRALTPYLFERMTAVSRTCPACGGTLAAPGFDQIEWLRAAHLGADALELPLASFGFRTGDVVAVGDGERTIHVELMGGVA